MTRLKKTAEGITASCPECGCDTAWARSADDPHCTQCGHLLWYRQRETGGVVFLDVIPTQIPGPEDVVQCCKSVLRSGPRRVVVNLSALDFATSEFVARLIMLHKEAHRAEIRLLLCGLSPLVREIFSRTRLDELFDIVDDETCGSGRFHAEAC
jgi:anti-anti-sigma factor